VPAQNVVRAARRILQFPLAAPPPPTKEPQYVGAVILFAPALDRCAKRDPDNPPRDLWCGPYLDPPTARDQEILRIFRAKGVADAFKASKPAAEYGIGAEKCRDCRRFAGGKLGECEKVCGLVRWNRRCDWYSEK
jgi:hypothetical protein